MPESRKRRTEQSQVGFDLRLQRSRSLAFEISRAYGFDVRAGTFGSPTLAGSWEK